MAELNLLAFLQNALTTTASEQGTLENLLYSRLLTGNFKISSAGVVSFAFTGQLADGTVGAPALTFANELTSGRYRIGANNIGESINSLKVIDWTASRLQLTSLNLIWGTDNAQDIGASGANRPRDLFLGRNALIGGTLGVTGLTTAATLAVTGTASIGGALTLTGGLNTPLASAQGGTGSAFFAISGPSALRTFALPDASATILTSSTPVTVAQGGTSLATLTANNVLLGNGTSAPNFVAPSTSGNLLTSNGTTWQSTTPSAPAWVLLHAGSGTTSSASAINVDTVAITGLTALDTLRVITHLETVTAGTATSMLYNNTDAVQCGLLAANGAVTVAQGDWFEENILGPKQADTKKITYREAGGSANNTTGFGTGQATFTTDWTGNWTLAYRIGAVTATGAANWRWAVYKVAGQ